MQRQFRELRDHAVASIGEYAASASSKIIRLVLVGVVGLCVAVTLGIISTILYFILRSMVVPKALLREPVYFDYSNAHDKPMGRIDLFSQQQQWQYVVPNEVPLDVTLKEADGYVDIASLTEAHRRSWLKRRFLKYGNYYSIDVAIRVPKSPRNLQHGKFMLQLTTFDSNLLPVAVSSRPIIIPYQSPVAILLDTLTHYPFYLLGFDDLHEYASLSVTMMDKYLETQNNVTQHLEFTLSTADIDISALLVTVMPALSGLAYLLYYYPTASFICGVMLLTAIQAGLFVMGAVAVWVYRTANTTETVAAAGGGGGLAAGGGSGRRPSGRRTTAPSFGRQQSHGPPPTTVITSGSWGGLQPPPPASEVGPRPTSTISPSPAGIPRGSGSPSSHAGQGDVAPASMPSHALLDQSVFHLSEVIDAVGSGLASGSAGHPGAARPGAGPGSSAGAGRDWRDSSDRASDRASSYSSSASSFQGDDHEQNHDQDEEDDDDNDDNDDEEEEEESTSQSQSQSRSESQYSRPSRMVAGAGVARGAGADEDIRSQSQSQSQSEHESIASSTLIPMHTGFNRSGFRVAGFAEEENEAPTGVGGGAVNTDGSDEEEDADAEGQLSSNSVRRRRPQTYSPVFSPPT